MAKRQLGRNFKPDGDDVHLVRNDDGTYSDTRPLLKHLREDWWVRQSVGIRIFGLTVLVWLVWYSLPFITGLLVFFVQVGALVASLLFQLMDAVGIDWKAIANR